MNFCTISPLPHDAQFNAGWHARYSPRRELLDEVLAGFLWMSLDPPEETSIDELKIVARKLAMNIRAGAREDDVSHQLERLQKSYFSRKPRPEVLRAIAKVSIGLVEDHR